MHRLIAVTGGTGFTGRGVVPMLLAEGFAVRALVRSEASSRKLAPHPDLTVVHGEATSAHDMAKLLEGCTALVHLVGIRRAEMKRRGLTYDDVDLASVIASLEAMQAQNVSKIILLSAAAIGKSTYVETKAKAERAVMGSAFQWTILRPAFIVGPGQMYPLIFGPILELLRHVPGKLGSVAKRAGNVTREELGRAVIHVLQEGKPNNKILEVGDIRAAARADR